MIKPSNSGRYVLAMSVLLMVAFSIAVIQAFPELVAEECQCHLRCVSPSIMVFTHNIKQIVSCKASCVKPSRVIGIIRDFPLGRLDESLRRMIPQMMT